MDVLKWIKKYLPETYWGNLEGNPGWEIFEVIADIGSFLHDRITNAIKKRNPLYATGGKYTVKYLGISNQSDSSITITKDETVAINPAGLYFVADETRAIAAGSLDTVLFRAVAMNEEYNYTQYREGEWLFEDTSINEAGVTIDFVSTHTDGVSPTLDVAAAERGLTRKPGETDAELRKRIVAVIGALTNEAIEQEANNLALSATAIDSKEVYDWILPFTDQGFCDQIQLLNCGSPWVLVNVEYNSANPDYETNIQKLASEVYQNKAAGVGMAIQDINSECINYDRGM
jgi:hypothetical protein